MRNRFLLALSLANLCYLQVWRDLLVLPPESAFVRAHPPAPFEYAAACCGVILGALIIFAISMVIRHGAVWVQAAWVLLLTLLVANAIRSVLSTYLSILRSGFFVFVGPKVAAVLAILLLACFYYLTVRFFGTFERVAALALGACLPLLLVTFGGSLYESFTQSSPEAVARLTAPKLLPSSSHRVMWVIFDEWDYRLSFVDRAPTLHLKNLDRLRSESFFAEDALPPADTTLKSIPSLIYGRQVKSAISEDATHLRLHFADGAEADFGSAPNVFSRARAAGFNTAAAGWYFPYCRTLPDALNECWWTPRATQENTTSDTFLGALLRQPRSLVETQIFSAVGQSLVTGQHAVTYSDLRTWSERFADDPAIGLAFIHFNIPHAPFFYDMRTGSFGRANYVNGYADALDLVDRTVGALRESMERAGTWNNTALVLSADHWNRAAIPVDHRVPFIVHMPGDNVPVPYSSELHTVRTADVILAILSGQVQNNRDVAKNR